MKLDILTNYRRATESLKTITLIAVIGCFIISSAIFIYMQNELKVSKKKIYVIDSKGNVSSANEENINTNIRVFEYENHVKTFYKLWYQLDQNTFKPNIEAALSLVGDCGKELFNEYKDQDLYSLLRSKNLVITVTIESVKIDINQKPFRGIIKGVQTIYRLKGEITRRMDCSFTLYDVDRSRENPHGVKIENWKVEDTSPVETKK
jgi:hypothetical protein